MCKYFELILTIFVASFSGHTRGEYEPLVLLEYGDLITYAPPHPSQTFSYHLDENEHLKCFCPPENGDEKAALLPVLSSTVFYCEISCKKELIPHVELNNVRCTKAPNSYFVSIGYRIAFEEPPLKIIHFFSWLSGIISYLNNLLQEARIMELVDFCLIGSKDNNVVNKVPYTVHTLLAPSAFTFGEPTAETDLNPIQYKNDHYHVNDPSPCYFENNQKQVFINLFKEDHEKYFKGPSNGDENDPKLRYFVKQQLVESDDMALNTWKKSTYYNLNTAPMWISVQEASWAKANRYIRLLSYSYKKKFIIFSGTYDHLKIKNKEITLLDPDKKTKIPVPLLFWKFIFDTETGLGIVILILNNIDDPPQKAICSTTECPIIDENDILENRQQAITGFMYCCVLDTSLRKILNLDTINISYKGPITIDIKSDKYDKGEHTTVTEGPNKLSLEKNIYPYVHTYYL